MKAPDPLDYSKQLSTDDDKIVKEVQRLMRIALYIDQSQIRVRTFPQGANGAPEDSTTRGSSIMGQMQLFDRMFTQSLRDGPLHGLMEKGRQP